MPITRPPYPAEFRRQIVDLVHAGRTAEELSREFEPSAQTIANWVRQAERDAGKRDDGPTSVEREELVRLRREVRQLRQERDILAKGEPSQRHRFEPMANAWFARESRATPNGSTGS